MSVTPSQFPSVSECPLQSRYKSPITAITSKNKRKNSSIYTPICKCYNFHVNQLI
ncbi:unnamed protein product, partial [Staurois parvus]